jgi:DNA-directed RNA polymerase III subunit RPC2
MLIIFIRIQIPSSTGGGLDATQKRKRLSQPKRAVARSTVQNVETPADQQHDGKKNVQALPPRNPTAGRVDPFDALLEPFYYSKSLTDPINTAQDKWNLLPAFLKVKGLVKQHIDSFNYFVEVQLKKIVQASSTIRSEQEHGFYIKYVFSFFCRILNV